MVNWPSAVTVLGQFRFSYIKSDQWLRKLFYDKFKLGIGRFQTVRSSGYRLAENNRLMRSSKVSGSNIVSGVHCLVHDVNIHLLTIEFGRLIIGGCHVAKQ